MNDKLLRERVNEFTDLLNEKEGSFENWGLCFQMSLLGDWENEETFPISCNTKEPIGEKGRYWVKQYVPKEIILFDIETAVQIAISRAEKHICQLKRELA